MKLLIFSVLIILFAGCAGKHRVVEQTSLKKHSISSVSTETSILDAYSHEPWTKEKNVPEWGIALAGGGSKSSPFALGVLKRIIDDGNMDKIDIISSVSGGGYAAYYLYAKALYAVQNPEKSLQLKDFFIHSFKRNFVSKTEKIKDFYSLDYPGTDQNGSKSCTSYHPNKRKRDYAKWVSCHQDLFLNGLSNRPKSKSRFEGIGKTTYNILASILTAPVHHGINSVFDQGINLAPSQKNYINGIVRTYGYTPENNANPTPSSYSMARNYMNESFSDLRRVIENNNMPMWVINTTNFENNWWQDYDKNPDLEKSIFEITPYGYGSGTHGYKKGDPKDIGLDVPESVLASAAFFDAMTPGSLRRLGFLGLHALNLRWNIYVDNFNYTNKERKKHRFMPFPFYYLDGASKIGLADGGQSGDNLGIYSLIKRGTKNIVVVSGSYDKEDDDKTNLEDICKVNHYLLSKGYYITLDKHPTESNKNLEFNLREKCSHNKLKKPLNFYEWKNKVITGNIFSLNSHYSEGDVINGIKIYFIKSALNKQALTALSRKSKNDVDDEGRTKCKYDRKDVDSYPCDLQLFWLSNGEGSATTFPQTDTVAITINSSMTLYNAYMDLGYDYAGFIKFD